MEPDYRLLALAAFGAGLLGLVVAYLIRWALRR